MIFNWSHIYLQIFIKLLSSQVQVKHLVLCLILVFGLSFELGFKFLVYLVQHSKANKKWEYIVRNYLT